MASLSLLDIFTTKGFELSHTDSDGKNSHCSHSFSNIAIFKKHLEKVQYPVKVFSNLRASIYDVSKPIVK